MADQAALLTISAIERACSAPSIVGSFAIIVSFCLSSSFQKPINRMLFYASFGNIMSNVATIMSRSFLEHPNSAGCQIQGFLIETFMFADVFWALAMAVNVYLTFYHQFDSTRLRRIEPFHIGLCYGVPFVPAMAFIFLKNKDGHRAYGNANLWCWITAEWDAWQLVTYGVIWLSIFITFTIYIRTGCTIYKWRRRLHGFTTSTDYEQSTQVRQNEHPHGPAKSTEVTVTTSYATTSDVEEAPQGAYSVSVSTDPATAAQAGPVDVQDQVRVPYQKPERKGRRQSDKAAIAYAKCASLFFAAMLITWIPSSANRLFILLTKESSLTLAYMSAFVLPLQGFWNALIYFSTSREACGDLIAKLKCRRRGPDSSAFSYGGQASVSIRQNHQLSQMKPSKKMDRYGDTESMTSLSPRNRHGSSDVGSRC